MRTATRRKRANRGHGVNTFRCRVEALECRTLLSALPLDTPLVLEVDPGLPPIATVTPPSNGNSSAGGDTSLAVPLNASGTGAFTQQAKLTASNGAAGDVFGLATAIDGDTLVVASPGAEVNGNYHQGAAYVYTRSGLTWTESAMLTASDGAADDIFGISVALFEDTVVVGRPSTSANGWKQGAAYVFVKSGSTWTQSAKLTASDGASGDDFGRSVAIDGNTVVVGAPQAAVGANQNQGATYVFVKSDSTWAEAAKLTAPYYWNGSSSGSYVDISGNTVVVGSGHISAYVFEKPSAGWSGTLAQSATLLFPDGVGNGLDDVAISGDVVVAGAHNTFDPASAAAYVYVKPASGWAGDLGAGATLKPSVVGDVGTFGWAVAIEGQTVVVGSSEDRVGNNDHQGLAYVFEKPSSGWLGSITEIQQLTAFDGAAGDRFSTNGQSLAISGTSIVAGAAWADVGGNADQGAAYVFTRDSSTSIALTPATLPAANQFIPYNQIIGVVGATGTTTLTVTNLQGSIAGLTIPNSAIDGLTISGTPTQFGALTFTVTAIDSASNTATKNYTLTVNPALLNAPTNLTATNSASEIYLSWTDNTVIETGYYVFRGLDDATFTQIADLPANTTAYTDAAVLPNVVYYYRVQAYNAGGTSGYSNVAVAALPGAGIPQLNSRPGATKSIYLDFDGDYQAVWGDYSNITTPPFDQDGYTSAFSAVELASIRKIWEYVSEDYAPFDVNVTTVEPANMNPGYTTHVVIGGDGAWLGSPAGGVAYLGGFTTGPSVCFVFPEWLWNGTAKYVGEAASHEAGHNFGLQHQSLYDAAGNKLAEYYDGYDNNGDVVAPIMGVSYLADRGVWWNGPNRVSSTTIQRDLDVLKQVLTLRVDDHGDTQAAATELTQLATAVSGSGVVGWYTDVDYFSFWANSGPASFTITGPMDVQDLDLKVSLYNAAGTLLTTVAPAPVPGSPNLNATVQYTLPGPGKYYLSVTGDNGRPDFDDVGTYSISGTVVQLPGQVSLAAAILPQDTVGIDYYETIKASGGVGTIRYTVSNLTGAIPGLTPPTSASGSFLISGTPTAAGTETFTVTAIDAAGRTASANYSVTVNPAVRVGPATLPADLVGKPYYQTITATGGTGPLTLLVRTILAPVTGLIVPTYGNGSLVISGTPTAPGTETFVVTAIDTLGATGSATYGITVNPAIVLSPGTLAQDTVGVPYSQTILAGGGSGTVRLAVSNLSGAIPGLSLPNSGTGTLLVSGTPTAVGTETFTVTATDAAGNTASGNYSITVNPAISLGPATLPAGAAKTAYFQTIAASGGTGAVRLAVSDVQGTIPGLILPTSATGSLAIRGMPTAAGVATFTVTATDAVGGTTSANYSIIVRAALSLGPTTLPADTAGVAYNHSIAASGGAIGTPGGSAALVVSNLAGAIPGLNVPQSGVDSLAISGTPTAAGIETFTVTATDSAGATVVANYSITVNPAVSLGPATLPPQIVNVACNQTIAAAGGTGTVTLAVSNIQGAIAGLNVPQSGVGALAISGTPTATGIETFTVTATDSLGGTATANYSIRVTPAISIAIADASVVEGNSGTVNMAFDVTLSAASTDPVSVKYATADGTALSASDYTAANGTLVFNPGETSKRIFVAVNGDSKLEPNETFLVNLSDPLAATLAGTLADAQAVGTIVNDDTTAPQAVPYSQNFSAGLPSGSAGWEYYSSNEGRITVVNGQLRMDDAKNNSVYSLNEAILHVDLSGKTGAQLKLDHASSGDEKHTFTGSQFTGHVNADLIALSVDGAHWVKVTDLSTNFTQKTFALDTVLATAATAAGAAAGADRSNVRIKLQQYDNQPWSLDGRAFDNIALSATQAARVALSGAADVQRNRLHDLALAAGQDTAQTAWSGDWLGPFDSADNGAAANAPKQRLKRR